MNSLNPTTTSPQRLVVTPMAALSGYYDLFAYHLWGTPVYLADQYAAQVYLHFYTGIWHWQYDTGSGSYNPVWSGWRSSYNVVNPGIISGNVHYDIDIPYPGTKVRTPDHMDPPGVLTQPNPINNYAVVTPNDVVDFYVRPRLCARTDGFVTYAKLDLSLIDVPYVIAELESGFHL